MGVQKAAVGGASTNLIAATPREYAKFAITLIAAHLAYRFLNAGRVALRFLYKSR